MWFAMGFGIYTDKKKRSEARANKDWYWWPKNRKNLKDDGTSLFFAGGEDCKFGLVDIEVWGLR